MTNANSDDSLVSHPIWYISNSGKDNCTYTDLELALSVTLSSFAKNCLSSGTSGWPDSVETNKDDLFKTSTFHPSHREELEFCHIKTGYMWDAMCTGAVNAN